MGTYKMGIFQEGNSKKGGDKETGLYLYALFHCNLAFSLIGRDEFRAVIKRCYRPLLDLAGEGLPIAIEMSAWTLRQVHQLDPDFTERLSDLWASKRLSFIGSGYAQSIMPLIPAEVNRWNLRLGNKHYEQILGRAPGIALVNEQTFSSGLVGLYKEAGYETIIMDWNNSCRHKNFSNERLYSPQRAAGRLPGEEIGLLWSHSIAFQKFSRCVHGEFSQKEYMDYLLSHYHEGEERAFVAYSNDAEVFDFRPGRGESPRGDFERVRELLKGIKNGKRFALITPEKILNKFKSDPADGPMRLESVETPVVSKKQERYNPVRWSVTGRDSAHINARCLRLYRGLERLFENGVVRDGDILREKLCELWGSDFRTNTCDDKLQYFNESMGWLSLETMRLLEDAGLDEAEAVGPAGVFSVIEERASAGMVLCGAGLYKGLWPGQSVRGFNAVEIDEDKRRISIRAKEVELILLKDRGLALSSASFPGISDKALLGTLGHGYFDSIELGADFFSGHLIHTSRDGMKTTDLRPASHTMGEDSGGLSISAHIETPIGLLEKTYHIPRRGAEFSVTYKLRASALQASSLRLGIFTLMPEAFENKSLWFETVNGGMGAERFYLKGHAISHDEPVSPAISASGCLGATEGWVAFGDKEKSLIISSKRRFVHTVPMINYRESGDKFFLRLYHSAGELDDTSYWLWRGSNEATFNVKAKGPA